VYGLRIDSKSTGYPWICEDPDFALLRYTTVPSTASSDSSCRTLE
jgi:hypothetical protein